MKNKQLLSTLISLFCGAMCVISGILLAYMVENHKINVLFDDDVVFTIFMATSIISVNGIFTLFPNIGSVKVLRYSTIFVSLLFALDILLVYIWRLALINQYVEITSSDFLILFFIFPYVIYYLIILAGGVIAIIRKEIVLGSIMIILFWPLSSFEYDVLYVIQVISWIIIGFIIIGKTIHKVKSEKRKVNLMQ